MEVEEIPTSGGPDSARLDVCFGLTPAEELLVQTEPLFELGIPGPGSWTCFLCNNHFPFLTVLIGNHVRNCASSRTENPIVETLIPETSEQENISGTSSVPIEQPIISENCDKENSREKSKSLLRKRKKSRKKWYFTTRRFKCKRCRRSYTTKGILEKHELRCAFRLKLGSLKNKKFSQQYQSKDFQGHLKKRWVKKQIKTPKPRPIVVQKLSKAVSSSPVVVHKSSKVTSPMGTKASISCKVCQIKFCSEEVLKSHSLEMDHSQLPTGSFQCAKCEKQLSTKSNLQQHLRRCLKSVETKICKICSKTLSSKQTLRDHYKTHFSHLRNRISDAKCGRCHKGFYSKYTLLNHSRICGVLQKKVQKVHKELPQKRTAWKCTSCRKSFYSKLSLQNHSSICARMDMKGKKLINKCGWCQKVFSRKPMLLKHIGICPKSKYNSGPCPICKKIFLRQLKRHIAIHRCKFRCEFCSASFQSLGGFNSHKALHRAKKNLTTTVMKKSLDAALARKTGRKKATCRICKVQIHTSRLAAHLRVHAGTRPFQCSHCSHAYVEKRGLGLHMANRHPGEVHAAASPSPKKSLIRTPARKSSMKKTKQVSAHGDGSGKRERKISGKADQSVNCPLCSRTIKQKGNLRRHMLTVHPESLAKPM